MDQKKQRAKEQKQKEGGDKFEIKIRKQNKKYRCTYCTDLISIFMSVLLLCIDYQCNTFTCRAVQAIFTFVGSWNNYFVPALVLQSKDKMTVPILIATLRGADYMNFDMGKIYMMITVAIVPIIIVYLLLSKYIIAGVTLGGVKE